MSDIECSYRSVVEAETTSSYKRYSFYDLKIILGYLSVLEVHPIDARFRCRHFKNNLYLLSSASLFLFLIWIRTFGYDTLYEGWIKNLEKRFDFFWFASQISAFYTLSVALVAVTYTGSRSVSHLIRVINRQFFKSKSTTDNKISIGLKLRCVYLSVYLLVWFRSVIGNAALDSLLLVYQAIHLLLVSRVYTYYEIVNGVAGGLLDIVERVSEDLTTRNIVRVRPIRNAARLNRRFNDVFSAGVLLVVVGCLQHGFYNCFVLVTGYESGRRSQVAPLLLTTIYNYYIVCSLSTLSRRIKNQVSRTRKPLYIPGDSF